MQDVASLVTGFVLLLVAVCIVLMWNAQRSYICKECPHCKRRVEDEKRANALAAHRQYHSYTTNVPGCEFCDYRGSSGVPPPTGPTKKE